MRVVPFIIVAIVALTIPLIWLLVQTLVVPAPEAGGPPVDSGARIEVEMLRQQVEGLQDQIDSLETELEILRSDLGDVQQSQSGAGGMGADGIGLDDLDDDVAKTGPNAIIDAYAQVVLIANRRDVSKGITVASPRFLEEFLGRPREVLSDRCEEMTNPKLKALLIVQDVGPIRVQMLQPAVDSLLRVFENVRRTDPDLYARINTAGSLCVRQIRGTQGRTSTHSFGLAVDLNIDGRLDTLGDGKTQLGLTILADFFISEGWVWGAGFSREDSMHFEVSRQQLTQWREEGKI